MTELRESFTTGSSKLEDFYAWMDKRHRIYLDRKAGKPKPWTDDPILQEFKFTNVFRELDPGTIALRGMEQATGTYQSFMSMIKSGVAYMGNDEAIRTGGLLLFNTWWWRIWNWHEHAVGCGFVTDYKQLEDYMLSLHANGARMWTSAHMVRGAGGELKVHTYLKMMRDVWVQLRDLTRRILSGRTLQAGFDIVLEVPLIGDFTAYEIVSDLRWNLLASAPDKYTWGNPGNGAIRGMRRLGLDPSVETMRWLWLAAPQHFMRLNGRCPLLAHYPVRYVPVHDDWIIYEDMPIKHEWPPFEIREIEHSLCEFDKYERARLGQGRPRQKFDGR